MRRIIIAALLLVAGCDPNAELCKASIDLHVQQCEGGDADACEWLATQVSPPGSYMCI